jgi:hypothetical protein
MTVPATPRPIIRLDWPFNADPPELYCPLAGADPDDLVEIEVLLEHTPLGEVPMVYELRTSGMACGPVSNRLWAGFDLAEGTP